MCSLYSLCEGQQAVRDTYRVAVDRTRAIPPWPEVFPDSVAPIVRNGPRGRELVMACWGMPSPVFDLLGKKTDPGVTNIRDTKSLHWRRWLDVESRCLVPFTSFSENEVMTGGQRRPVWFGFQEHRPMACFAGIWTRRTSMRKLNKGEITADLFGFLTCNLSGQVGAIHPQAMPVIFTTSEECDAWMGGSLSEALRLQRPLPTGWMRIVARGEKQGGGEQPVRSRLKL